MTPGHAPTLVELRIVGRPQVEASDLDTIARAALSALAGVLVIKDLRVIDLDVPERRR